MKQEREQAGGGDSIEAMLPPAFDPVAFTLGIVAAELPDLVRDLATFRGVESVSLLAGLLTVPAYQARALRLETLTCLAVVYARGARAPVAGDADRWLAALGASSVGRYEDPPEDLFVSRITDIRGDHLVLTGLWENAAFYTQLVVDLVEMMPATGKAVPVKHTVAAVLALSGLVCARANLRRYEAGSEKAPPLVAEDMGLDVAALGQRVLFSTDDLHAAGIDPDDLEPLLITTEQVVALADEPVHVSTLHNRPVLFLPGDRFLVALPGSLTLALRTAVITAMEGAEDLFDRLLQVATARALAARPFLGGPGLDGLAWEKTGSTTLGNATMEIDEGHFLNVGVVLPSVRAHTTGGFLAPVEADDAFHAGLEQAQREAVELAKAQPGFQRGFQLWIFCGWGKGISAMLPDLPDGEWRAAGLSIADLSRISVARGMSRAYLWKAMDGQQAIEDAGLRFINMSGLPNMLAWMRSNDGHFVPHNRMRDRHVSPEQPADFLLPTNAMRQLYIECDRGVDAHSALDPFGVLHHLQYPSNAPLFKDPGAEHLYLSISAARVGELVVVYEGQATYWVTVEAPGLPALRADIVNVVSGWLRRVVRVLENRLRTKGLSAHLLLRFEDTIAVVESLPTVDEGQLEALIRLNDGAMTVTFAPGFLTGTRLPDNTAERLVARAMASMFVRRMSGRIDDALVSDLMPTIVPGTMARTLHMMRARTFSDRIQAFLTYPLVEADDVDLATARIGLGWRALLGDSDGRVSGKKACKAFLGTVVDVLLADIQAQLRSHAQVPALTRMLWNLEKASLEEARWRRTSAAMMELAEDRQAATEALVEQLGRVATVNTAGRILVEMALCTCPEDGDVLSDMALSRLMAKAVLVYHFGGISDAIHFSVLAPELHVSALGNILLRDEFGHLVVTPLLTRAVSDKVIREAPEQKENYTEPAAAVPAEGRIDPLFYEAWTVETGCDIDSARDIIGALDDAGTELETPVFAMRRSQVISLARERGVDAAKAYAFLEQFTLIHRDSWDKVPPGFEQKEIYPWRLGRRLSFLTRPILEVRPGNDPLLLVAPGSLQRGFTYVIDQTLSGRLRRDFFKTALMRDAWLGRAGEGHTFNQEVAEALKGSGWTVRENVGLPEILGQPTARDFGDIDVLAWRAGRSEVLLIECKDLSFSRNHSEIAGVLSEYQGQSPGGKPDLLRKHLNRVALATDNIDRVRRFTGVPDATVTPWFVFSKPVPMQYARIEALEGVCVGQVEDVLSHR